MRWPKQTWTRLRSLWQRREVKREIDEELRLHLQMRTAENIAAGMPPDEAAREARRRFGNVQTIREECREIRGASLGETTLQDIRFGGRMLRKNLGFTAVAVLSLAIGIGVNTTIFSALDAAFFRPLPISNFDEIVRFEWPEFTFEEFQELQSHLQSLSDLVAVSHHGSLLRGNEGTTELLTDYVSRNYFTALGVKPAMGTLFSKTDARLGSAPVVVISYGLWQRRFGGDPKIVGQTIPLWPRPATVLGVAAKGFTGVDRIVNRDLWFPNEAASGGMGPRIRDFELLGRLRAGYSAPQVQAEVETFVAHLAWDLPKGRPDRVTVQSERKHDGGGASVALLVMAVVGLVLLVACANVSGLLLARYEDRRRELAVRVALGGGRLRLLRQLLIEGLLLSLLGAVAVLLLTTWAVRIVPSVLPPIIAPFAPVLRVDGRVLGLAMGLACLATLVFALLPAWSATRVDVGALLKGEFAPASSRARWFAGRNALVIAQLAVSLVFLATTALLVRAFINGMRTNLGFNPKNLMAIMFYGSSNGERYFSQLQERVRALPGVRAVSLATRVPFAPSGGGLTIKVLTPQRDAEVSDLACSMIEPTYFKALGVPLLRGREFSEHDNRTGPRVMIVSQAAAKRFWPGEDPLGKTLQVGFDKLTPCQVVGVVGDVDNFEVGEMPAPFIYLPFRQEARGDVRLVVRTTGQPAGMAEAVRCAMREVDKNVVVAETSTMGSWLRLALLPLWVGAWLGGVLGALAFLLAVSGLYGVVAYAVSRRTRELGIRMAMGAGRRDVVWLVLRQGLILALAGTILGLPMSVAAGVAMRGLLFGIAPTDPLTLAGSMAVVIFVALVASYFPARRAARLNSMEALRYE